jgi:vitamin B12 transporter
VLSGRPLRFINTNGDDMTSRIKALLLSTIGLIGITGNAAWADENLAADPQNPETIVVTASRLPQDIRTVGSSISVITSDEIDRFQERFLLDALDTTPGLSSAQAGPPGGTASVFLRGADSYQTMVLIDGVPVDDPSGTQSAFDFGRLLATDIQKVEILRGPQSTLYGGDAIGGVINITTARKTDGFAASGFAEGGSYGTRTFAGNVSGGVDNLSGYLNATQYNTTGFPAADARLGGHLPDGLETTAVTGGGHLTAADWLGFDLALRSADSEAGFAGSSFKLGRPIDSPNEARTHERSERLSAVTSFFDGGLTGTLSVMDSTTRRHSLDFVYGPSIFDGERQKAEYVATGKLSEWLTFVAGASWQADLAHTSYDTRHSTTTDAGFGEFQAQPIENLYLTAGGRIDSHSAFGDFETYRVTAAYRIEQTGTKFHAADGTGFRAPSLYELYDTYSGNKLLTPEKSQGWEVGIDQSLASFTGLNAMLKATYFDQQINNRIAYSSATFRYFNSGHTMAQGVELEADITPVKSVELRAVYTYDRTKDLSTGLEALRRPLDSGALIAAWQATEALDLTLKLNAVGQRLDSGGHNLSGYAKADIGAQYTPMPHVTLEARIENIADTHYEEIYGYGTPGRSVYGGVALKY